MTARITGVFHRGKDARAEAAATASHDGVSMAAGREPDRRRRGAMADIGEGLLERLANQTARKVAQAEAQD